MEAVHGQDGDYPDVKEDTCVMVWGVNLAEFREVQGVLRGEAAAAEDRGSHCSAVVDQP